MTWQRLEACYHNFKKQKKKKGRGGKRQGSKFAKKKRRTSRGDERCAVNGSFEGNGHKYKE